MSAYGHVHPKPNKPTTQIAPVTTVVDMDECAPIGGVVRSESSMQKHQPTASENDADHRIVKLLT